MKVNDKKYPKARYDFDTNPQVFGFEVGETYQFRDFGRGIEVFYDDSCSLAMGYNMFNECFTKLKANETPEKIYIHVRANKEPGTTWHGKKITNSDIEYTRTDVFIEKAIDWIDYNNRNGGCNFDGWKKDFKKYIEDKL